MEVKEVSKVSVWLDSGRQAGRQAVGVDVRVRVAGRLTGERVRVWPSAS